MALPPPEPFKDGQLVPPEFAGLKIIFRAAGPLLLALAGTAPVIAAARAVRAAKPIDPYVAAGAAAGFLVLPVAFTVAWVRFREPARVVEELPRRGPEGGGRTSKGTESDGAATMSPTHKAKPSAPKAASRRRRHPHPHPPRRRGRKRVPPPRWRRSA